MTISFSRRGAMLATACAALAASLPAVAAAPARVPFGPTDTVRLSLARQRVVGPTRRYHGAPDILGTPIPGSIVWDVVDLTMTGAAADSLAVGELVRVERMPGSFYEGDWTVRSIEFVA